MAGAAGGASGAGGLVALVVLVVVGVVLVAPVLAAALLVVAGGRPSHPPTQPCSPTLWPHPTILKLRKQRGVRELLCVYVSQLSLLRNCVAWCMCCDQVGNGLLMCMHSVYAVLDRLWLIRLSKLGCGDGQSSKCVF